MKSSLQKKTITLILAFSILSLTIAVFVIVPTIKNIIKQEEQTVALRIYLEKRQARATKLRSSLKKISLIKAAANEYQNRLFAPGQELMLITLLEATAAKNKVAHKISNSNLDQLSNQQINIRLNVVGEYNNALNYLLDLEKLDYFIAVRQLQFFSINDQQNRAEGGKQASLNLELSIYVNR